MNEFLINYWPAIAGGLIALLALVLMLRRRGQRVELNHVDSVIAPTLVREKPADPVIATGPMNLPDAIVAPSASDAPDDLQRIKGLGPKVATRLNELGIVRFAQLAALDADAQARLDAQLGPFAGRLARDRWVRQAELLASDDIAAFEEQFGKLG